MVPVTKRPVFLHGMWRCGSTYVWSKFRALNGTYCYYEPLHQGLGRITKERIERDTPETHLANAHPAMTKPYFHEYAPLVNGRGIKGFHPRMGYNPFILDSAEKDDELRAYVAHLISFAEKQGKIPVLGFNRTGLRVAWMKENFDAVQVHIDRDPRDIFESYMKFLKQGNYTFFTSWMIILEHNHEKLAPLFPHQPVREGWVAMLQKPKDFYRKVIDTMGAEKLYEMVFTFWLLTTLHGLEYADMILDVNRSDEAGYIDSLDISLFELTGLKPSFQDIKSDSRVKKDASIDYASVEHQVIKNWPFEESRHNPVLQVQLHDRKQSLIERLAA